MRVALSFPSSTRPISGAASTRQLGPFTVRLATLFNAPHPTNHSEHLITCVCHTLILGLLRFTTAAGMSDTTASSASSASSTRYPPSAIFSQSSRYAHHIPTLRSIHQLAASSSSRCYGRLERLCVEFGPRLSGSGALEAAIDWVASELRTDGLDRVWEQPVAVPCWQRGEARAFVVSPAQPGHSSDATATAGDPSTPPASASPVYSPSLHRPLHVLSIGLSCSTPPSGITARLVEVRSFDALSSLVAADPDAVRGRIVLYNAPFVSYDAAVQYRTRGAMVAEQHGAVAVLVRSVTPISLDTPHTGNQRPSALPALCVSIESAELLTRLLRLPDPAADGVLVHVFSSARMLADRPSRNICAEVRGRSLPSEYVLVGAHIGQRNRRTRPTTLHSTALSALAPTQAVLCRSVM